MRPSRLLPRLRRPAPLAPGGAAPAARRVLFLDDDPRRAEVFLAEHPEAVWVTTAAECIARLADEWDEVHLDHDLGGERFVDGARDDCGMEVVRWLCLERRPHLARARFLVHSHNALAAATMGMDLSLAGFSVELRPFGLPPLPPPPPAEDDNPPPGDPPPASPLRRFWRFFARPPA